MYLKAYRIYRDLWCLNDYTCLQVVTDDPDLAIDFMRSIDGVDFEVGSRKTTFIFGRNCETLTLNVTKGMAKIVRIIGPHTDELHLKARWTYWTTLDRSRHK